MAKQTTINRSFFEKLNSVEDNLEDFIEDKLTDIAIDAVVLSPVDTGAYVTSFSFVPKGSGGGRMRNSNNKPRRQNAEVKRSEGLQQLKSDIARLDLKEVSGVTLRNRSPHAKSVEDKYRVFFKLGERI